MPRASSVSEKVWAQAIHAVTVQKMSLRRAAQLYGVHHMSLHRRVRGRYMTNQPSRFEEDFQLTSPEEQEALMVLREQFMHEGDISADDVRYVVRTIASQDGRREIPNDFPLNRWISNFKRVHGLVGPPSPRTSAPAASPVPSPPMGMPMGLAPPPCKPRLASNAPPPLKYAKPSNRASTSAPVINQNNGKLFATMASERPSSSSRSSSTASTSPYDYYPRAVSNEHEQAADSTSESESEHHRESHEREARMANMASEEKRCRQSNTVSPEVWEKAMDAVEVHGMSLRNAAKAFGVHFAALHRRVKKRALKKEQSPPLENYIPFEDEAGIVRVIHARADLGLLMGFGELVDLLNRTALKYTMVTPELSRAIVRRFQSRVEQSIRHLIKDWPLPHLDAALHRYHSSDASPRNEEKMASPLPPHLPALFPRSHASASAEPKAMNSLGGVRAMHSPTAQQEAYARSRFYDQSEASPMEIEQRTSILRL